MLILFMIDVHDRWIAKFIPEHHTLRVGARTFAVRFAPVMFFEEYSEEQLQALVRSSTWEASFGDRP